MIERFGKICIWGMYKCPAVETYLTHKEDWNIFFFLFFPSCRSSSFLVEFPFFPFVILSCTLNLLHKQNMKWYCNLEISATTFSQARAGYTSCVAQEIEAKNHNHTMEIYIVIIRPWCLALRYLKEYKLSVTVYKLERILKENSI